MVPTRQHLLQSLRSSTLMAAGTFVAAWLSFSIGFEEPPLALLWIPGALVLVAVLARGPFHGVGAAAGLIAWAVTAGLGPFATLMLLLASVASPMLAAIVLRRWSVRAPTASSMTNATRMLGVIMLLHAPLAALFDLHGFWHLPIARSAPWLLYLGCYASEAMSGVVLARAFLALIPDVPESPSPTVDWRHPLTRIGTTELAVLAIIAAATLATLLAAAGGHVSYARLVMIPLFGTAMVASLITTRRFSALVLIGTVVVVFWLRTRIEPFSTDIGYLTNIGQHVLLLLIGGAMLHLLGASHEERNAQQALLERQAVTDEASGRPNMRALQQHLHAWRSEPERRPLRIAELVFADMLNWADLAGRRRLIALERAVGARIGTLMPEAKIIAHIGTGRFIVILDRDAVDDTTLRERVRAGLDGHRLEAEAGALLLRVSIGVVDTTGDRDLDVESLLAALSIAQQRAASSAERFHSERSSATQIEAHRAQLHWVESVRHSVHHGRIRLLAQPIVVAAGRSGPAGQGSDRLHYEILARLLDDQGREISPNRFLPAIARARLLEQFDRSVVERTLARLGADPALHRRTECCAINITGPTLCDAGFPDFLKRELDRYGIQPGILALEITESDSIHSFESALKVIGELNRIGVTIAIDDFGTGLATFDYVRKFKPQWLKIDGSFVRTFDDDPLNREIVHSIIRVAHVIGARTVAECVESEALAKRMGELGIDCLQGYAIDRPMPIEALLPAHDAHRRSAATRPLVRTAAGILLPHPLEAVDRV